MAHPGFDLSGKVALVTGGNSGIGLGMAEGLAKAGADVCIWGTNEEKNAAARTKLEAHGRRVAALRCDVGEEAQVEEAFAATLKALGRVDACFANAGVPPMAPSFIQMTEEEWHRVLRINLDGVFFTFRAAARHMVERDGGGTLVATSSLSAVEGQARGQHYAATKGGVISMVKALAVEHARHGIRAHAIVPGWIVTGMTDGWINVGAVRGEGPPPGAAAPLGHGSGLRGDRRVPGQRRERLPYGRHVRHRRRLLHLLTDRPEGAICGVPRSLRRCGVPKTYASLLRNRVPCIWHLLNGLPLSGCPPFACRFHHSRIEGYP